MIAGEDCRECKRGRPSWNNAVEPQKTAPILVAETPKALIPQV